MGAFKIISNEIIKEEIIHKGAEANLIYGHWFGKEVIFKHRIPKGYRIEQIDKKLRVNRSLNEAKALIRVKTYGVNVPQVYEIDTKNSTIVMKYIKGEKLKEALYSITDEKKEQYLKEVGKIIAILHRNGHVHGDITTSNIIITETQEVFIIDFGLHAYSDHIEDKSTDLHLFKRVLISSHGNDFSICFEAFLEGYREGYGLEKIKECENIIKNLAIIETRGRYVKKEDRI
ncbi:MAG: Kae1-associated serine/threonine protein kinase [Candidatus Lokiarchaeota archaeon]|nr:Kae1-associated serine/threonine protein kinase [Candidatus Lokiarchaeota archaeon]